MPDAIEKLEATIARQLRLSARLARIQCLRDLLAALEGNPSADPRDLIRATLAFEKLVNDRAESRARQ